MFSGLISGSTSTTAKMISAGSTPLEAILLRDDLSDHINDNCGTGQQLKHLLLFVEKNVPKILSSAQKTIQSIVAKNCAALLVTYCQHNERCDSINKVVPNILSLLKKSGSLGEVTSGIFQRVLLAAFEKNFQATINSIEVSMGPEIVHGAIRHLAYSSTVVETLISIFGSALNASTLMSAEPDIFTSSWIMHRFPFYIAQYSSIAMSTLDNAPFFYFLQELLKRSGSLNIGPLVDDLLETEAVGGLIKAVLAAAEASDGSMDNFPLAPEGIGLLISIVGIVRRSLPPTESCNMYNALLLHAPLNLLLDEAPRLVAILKSTKSVSKSFSKRGLGYIRLNIIEIFVELVLFQTRATDEAVFRSGFMEELILLVEMHPQHDLLMRALQRVMIAILHRPQFDAETKVEQCIRDPLLNFLVHDDYFVDKVKGWVGRTNLYGTSLQAHGIHMAMKLVDMPALKSQRAALEEYNDAVLKDRIKPWLQPITGENFSQIGSATRSRVVHLPLQNPNDVSLETTPPQDAVDAPIDELPATASVTHSSSERGSTRREHRYASAYDFDDDPPPAEDLNDSGFASFRDFEVPDELLFSNNSVPLRHTNNAREDVVHSNLSSGHQGEVDHAPEADESWMFDENSTLVDRAARHPTPLPVAAASDPFFVPQQIKDELPNRSASGNVDECKHTFDDDCDEVVLDDNDDAFVLRHRMESVDSTEGAWISRTIEDVSDVLAASPLVATKEVVNGGEGSPEVDVPQSLSDGEGFRHLPNS